MALYKGANNAYSTLAAAIDDTTTTITVQTGEGDRFPSTFPFPITVNSEIMLCTNRSGDTLTVTRGAESTSAVPHSEDAGVHNRITYGYFSELNDAVDDKLDATGGTVTGTLNIDNTTGKFKLPVGTDLYD